jgi:hypothetical protein
MANRRDEEMTTESKEVENEKTVSGHLKRGVILQCNSTDSCAYYIREKCPHSKPHEKMTGYEDKCDGTCHKAEARCIEVAR